MGKGRRVRPLPVLFMGAQLLLWFSVVASSKEPPDTIAWITAFCATALAMVALDRRHRAPLAALGVIVAVSVVGQILAPPDLLGLVPGLAVMVALFTVTVLCSWPVGLGATAAVAVVQLLQAAARHGVGGLLLSDWLTGVGPFLLVSALGTGRRHWLRERRATAERLAGAEQQQAQAAEAERERLAGELHDISAHHLTSVVVSVEAARRLGDSRPDLAAEALAFARRTARETQSALRRLVAVMQVDDPPAPQAMTAPIETLIAGFSRLGRPVSVSLPADLTGPAAEAALGIIREALTNALRYAPGAAVSVRVQRAGDTLRLTVDNGRPPGGAHTGTAGIGSGRGVAGMHRRAAVLGGRLSAGPRPDGSWRVHAVLPDAGSGPRPSPGRRRDFPREQRIADRAVFGSAAAVASSVALTKAEDAGYGAGTCLLLVSVLTLHALPLLWRRHAPWAVLAVTGAAALLWPVLLRGSALPPSSAICFLGGGIVAPAAVYAVAAYGRVLRTAPVPSGQHVPPPTAHPLTCPAGSRLSFLSVPAAVLPSAISLTAAFAADGTLLGDPAGPFLVLFLACWTLVLSGLGCTAAWGAGWLMHRRRRRELGREDTALTTVLSSTRAMVHGERQRVAVGLRETVLRQTDRMISSAEEGSLEQVAVATRATLSAMRQLLGSLDAGRAPKAPRRAVVANTPRM
ncbi:sensor histidine kinase [Streptomyces diastaticus]|uniref:sensor histidine kinase n=1 Tax=Streptomyces diastaticus TaxID=1956 RepID=UPI00366328F4